MTQRTAGRLMERMAARAPNERPMVIERSRNMPTARIRVKAPIAAAMPTATATAACLRRTAEILEWRMGLIGVRQKRKDIKHKEAPNSFLYVLCFYVLRFISVAPVFG